MPRVADGLAAHVKALLDTDAGADDGRARLADQGDEAQHGAALGEEVVDEQDTVIRAEEARRHDDIVVALMGKRGDLGGQDFAVDVARLGLLGEDNRHAEMLCGDARDADARSLDGSGFW